MFLSISIIMKFPIVMINDEITTILNKIKTTIVLKIIYFIKKIYEYKIAPPYFFSHP